MSSDKAYREELAKSARCVLLPYAKGLAIKVRSKKFHAQKQRKVL